MDLWKAGKPNRELGYGPGAAASSSCVGSSASSAVPSVGFVPTAAAHRPTGVFQALTRFRTNYNPVVIHLLLQEPLSSLAKIDQCESAHTERTVRRSKIDLRIYFIQDFTPKGPQ